MRSITGFFLFCALLTLVACDEAATDAGNTGTKTAADTTFSIERLEIDTLYWGETAKLIGTSFGRDTAAIKIFRGTVPMRMIAVSDSFLYFSVGEARSGELRVYKHDHQARGAVNITIIPHGDGFVPTLEGLAPHSAMPGEQFVVLGDHLDIRRRDVSVRLGKRALQIDSLTRHAIYCRVPEGATADDVFLFHDHRSKLAGRLLIAPPESGDLAAHHSFTQMIITFLQPAMVKFTEGVDDGRILDDEWLADSVCIPLKVSTDIRYGIRISGSCRQGSDSISITSALRLEGNTYSGLVDVQIQSDEGGDVQKRGLRLALANALLRPTAEGLAFMSAGPFEAGAIALEDYHNFHVRGLDFLITELIESRRFDPEGDRIPKITIELR